MSIDYEKLSNIEAECCLLAAIFRSNNLYEKVETFLSPDHFVHPMHKIIYNLCEKLISQGHAANPVSIKSYIDNDAQAQEYGGYEYVVQVSNSLISMLNAHSYGQIIYTLAIRRSLIDIGGQIISNASNVDIEENVNSHIENAEQSLYALANAEQNDNIIDFKTALIQSINAAEIAHRSKGGISGITTSFSDLDAKIGGLHKSDLIIVAGRPSMGKTAFATNIAFAAAQKYKENKKNNINNVNGGRVAFFSLEMSAEQLATRILAQKSQVNSHNMKTGKLSKQDFMKVMETSKELQDLDLFIDENAATTVNMLRNRCRRLIRQKGIDLIIIDYLQLLSTSNNNYHDNRVNEISYITRQLKSLAKEFNIPVIALSQLSRAVEQRENKRPQLSDLRESGSIEQDADVVMFLFRESYYLEREEPKRKTDENDNNYLNRYEKWTNANNEAINKAEVIIAKQRHGPIGSIELYFNPEYTQFDNLSKHNNYKNNIISTLQE